MQIHAVPEHDRYTDSTTGIKYPWGYESTNRADILRTERQIPVERESGPFGRSVRRRGTSRSRSKTAEPKKEEDRLRHEIQKAEDEVFLRMRGDRESAIDAAPTKPEPSAVASTTKPEVSEPMEVLLYGFGAESQWAAIDFYEVISNGVILEDYERHAPSSRPDLQRARHRVAAQRSLSKMSLKRKNKFAGGEHWIKVTFDSPAAATLACDKSPHIIRGHLVYAEPWRGAGPARDEAIFATNAGAQITDDVLPKSFSTNALNVEPEEASSETISSATVAGADAAAQDVSVKGLGWPQTPSAFPRQPQSSSTGFSLQQGASNGTLAAPRLTRIAGATPAKLLPADMALMPKQPKQSWAAWLSGSEVIGATVPRNAGGKFDWERAGVYWRVVYWLDMVMGWDLCGLKGE